MIRSPAALAARLAACACAISAFATATAAASGSPVPLQLEVSALAQGGLGRLAVVLSSEPGARCSLRVTGAGLPAGFSGRLVGSAGRLSWSWDPPPPAAQRPWNFLARCARGSWYSWRHERLEMGFPALAGALDVVSPGAGSCDLQGLCFAGDPFPVGQCTWYAQGRRPDLLGMVSGNASGWLEEVQGRVPVGTVPVVGALAVWRANTGPAGADGHVAYVAAVAGQRILLDDSNWRPTSTSSELQVHEHWEPTGSPSGYIYGGPAADGP